MVRLYVRPSTARQKVSTHLPHTPHTLACAKAHRIIVVFLFAVASTADDRAVSESADAHCHISGARVSS